ncbi:hypothetical protein HZP67_09890 [Elizabethkingia anophelis]|nr:hypothetical protein [Elizabethkingia anophelis]MCT4148152.1 hypothetical protein [Elizabethkingia anophelis]
MKTKFVKIPVSDRLPEKSGLYYIKHNNHPDLEQYDFFDDLHDGEYFETEVEWWLEEKEDHSEEMLSMLQRILDLNILPAEIDDEVISLTLKAQGYDMNQINEISQNGFERTKQLINKVKDNG